MSGAERAAAMARGVRDFIERHEGLEWVRFEPEAHVLLLEHDEWEPLRAFAAERDVDLVLLDG